MFPKQIINYVTTITIESKTVTTVTTTPPLKSILKKQIEIQTMVQKQNQKQNQKTSIKEENEEEEKDYRFQEFVKRQLYVGWLICALTFGFCLLP